MADNNGDTKVLAAIEEGNTVQTAQIVSAIEVGNAKIIHEIRTGLQPIAKFVDLAESTTKNLGIRWDGFKVTAKKAIMKAIRTILWSLLSGTAAGVALYNNVFGVFGG